MHDLMTFESERGRRGYFASVLSNYWRRHVKLHKLDRYEADHLLPNSASVSEPTAALAHRTATGWAVPAPQGS